MCRCTPQRGIVAMDAKLLTEMVEKELGCISVTPNLRRAATQAMMLGDICYASGHTAMAIGVWREAYDMVRYEDSQWVYIPLNTRLFRLDDVVSKDEACALGRRIDRAFKAVGLGELAGYGRRAQQYYRDLWLEKYFDALP